MGNNKSITYKATFCKGYVHAGKPGYETWKKTDEVLDEATGTTEMEAIRNLMLQNKEWYWSFFRHFTDQKEIFTDEEWEAFVDEEFRQTKVEDIETFNRMLGFAFDDCCVGFLDRWAKLTQS